MAKKSKKAGEVVEGDAGNQSAIDQAKEARGIDDKEQQSSTGGESEAKQAGKIQEEADPMRKAEDIKLKARSKVIEEQGGVQRGGPGGIKVGEKVHKGPYYRGDLTVSGVSGETGEAISVRLHIPNPEGVTEDGVFYRFKAHHPSAIRDKNFKIDPDNKDDPLLRTHLE